MNSKQLGSRIRQVRERRGLSQDDLAEAWKKRQGEISAYETGKRRVAAVELPTLAAILAVPVSYFFEDEEKPSTLDDTLLSYFHDLPDAEAQRAAIDIMRSFHDLLQRYQS